MKIFLLWNRGICTLHTEYTTDVLEEKHEQSDLNQDIRIVCIDLLQISVKYMENNKQNNCLNIPSWFCNLLSLFASSFCWAAISQFQLL